MKNERMTNKLLLMQCNRDNNVENRVKCTSVHG